MLACLSGMFVRKLHRRDLAVRYALGSVQLFCIWVLLLGADFAFWFNRHFLATANLLDQLETLVLGRFFQQDLRYVPLPQSLLRLTLGECFPLERHPPFWPPY